MKTSKSVYFLKNWNDDVVNWNEALINYNQSVLLGNLTKGENGFYVSHEAHKISKVKKVLEDNNLNYAHLYFNIITQAKTFGKHKDEIDVWFWQCQGVTKWIIEDKEEFILNTGDLIYIPTGFKHEVVPLSPRLGISMSKE
jgi:quercetin dioxygenase-like cupin family protein